MIAIGTGLFMGAGGRLLTAGWLAVRKRVTEVAHERICDTGEYLVVAETPMMDEFLEQDNRKGWCPES